MATPTLHRFIGAGTPMRDLVRNYPWHATALGAIDGWPGALRTSVSVVLHAAQPMFLYWGDAMVQIYNDAFVPCFGAGKHPAALGQNGPACWAEAWATIGPQIEHVRQGGEPQWYAATLVPIVRNGRLEDVYWNYSYTPVYDDRDRVGGVLVPQPGRRRSCHRPVRCRSSARPAGRAAAARRSVRHCRLGPGSRRGRDPGRGAAAVRRAGAGVPGVAVLASRWRLPPVPGTIHGQRVRHAEPARSGPGAGAGHEAKRAPARRPRFVVAHQGRIPGHAGPRAAQSAGAHRHRAQADEVTPSRMQRHPARAGRDPAPGRSPGAAGGRSAGRVAHCQRQGRAAQGRRGAGRRAQQGNRDGCAADRTETSPAAGRRAHRALARRSGAAGAGGVESAQQCRPLHAGRRPHHAGHAGARALRADPGHGRRQRHPGHLAAAHLRSVRAGQPQAGPRQGRARHRAGAGAQPGADARRHGRGRLAGRTAGRAGLPGQRGVRPGAGHRCRHGRHAAGGHPRHRPAGHGRLRAGRLPARLAAGGRPDPDRLVRLWPGKRQVAQSRGRLCRPPGQTDQYRRPADRVAIKPAVPADAGRVAAGLGRAADRHARRGAGVRGVILHVVPLRAVGAGVAAAWHGCTDHAATIPRLVPPHCRLLRTARTGSRARGLPAAPGRQLQHLCHPLSRQAIYRALQPCGRCAGFAPRRPEFLHRPRDRPHQAPAPALGRAAGAGRPDAAAGRRLRPRPRIHVRPPWCAPGRRVLDVVPRTDRRPALADQAHGGDAQPGPGRGGARAVPARPGLSAGAVRAPPGAGPGRHRSRADAAGAGHRAVDAGPARLARLPDARPHDPGRGRGSRGDGSRGTLLLCQRPDPDHAGADRLRDGRPQPRGAARGGRCRQWRGAGGAVGLALPRTDYCSEFDFNAGNRRQRRHDGFHLPLRAQQRAFLVAGRGRLRPVRRAVLQHPPVRRCHPAGIFHSHLPDRLVALAARRRRRALADHACPAAGAALDVPGGTGGHRRLRPAAAGLYQRLCPVHGFGRADVQRHCPAAADGQALADLAILAVRQHHCRAAVRQPRPVPDQRAVRRVLDQCAGVVVLLASQAAGRLTLQRGSAVRRPLLLDRLPIGAGRDPQPFAERGGKVAGVVKADQQRDVLDVDVGILEQFFAAPDARFADKRKHRHAGLLAEHLRQLFAVRAHAAGDFRQPRQRSQVVGDQALDGGHGHGVGVARCSGGLRRGIAAGRGRGCRRCRGALRALGQVQVHLDARSELARRKRLGDVIDAADRQAHDAFLVGVGPAQENHGNVRGDRVGLEQAAGGIAVHVGHAHVEQDQVGMVGQRHLVALQAVERHRYLVRHLAQQVDQQALLESRIVNDQDLARGAVEMRHGSP
uniref:Uncharacterized protein n=1 Tax=Tanacetum cinerariifolium TaxID=118510 RepID=A0A699GFS5_TANCI|nr:hypothetical protein [Tanacetum cinerariifolium]